MMDLMTWRRWGVNGSYGLVRSPQRSLDDRDGIVVRWDAAKGPWIPMSASGGYASR